MSRIDMSIGGWVGWYYGPWGKAKVWRIHAPNGEMFIPGELLSIRENQANIGVLSGQVARLRSMQLPLTRDDFLTVEAAYFILQGLLTMYAPAVTNTVFERRAPHRAFNLRLNKHAIFHQPSE